jgi:hypothetical protein
VVERNVVFFCYVQIFVQFADVDVSDEERFVQGGSDFRTVKGFVEDMAIEAPVAAKDQENSFVGCGGLAKSLGDFLRGIDALGIDGFVFERLAKAGCRGVLCSDQAPLAVLVIPGLRHGDVLLLEFAGFICGQGELQGDDVEIGSLVGLLDDLRGEVGQALRFPAGPESDFVVERDGTFVRADDFGGGRLRVKSGEGGGVAGKDGGAPLIERGEGLGVCGSGEKKCYGEERWTAHRKGKNSMMSEGSCESRRVEKWKGKKLKSAARRYKGGTGALPVINWGEIQERCGHCG